LAGVVSHTRSRRSSPLSNGVCTVIETGAEVTEPAAVSGLSSSTTGRGSTATDLGPWRLGGRRESQRVFPALGVLPTTEHPSDAGAAALPDAEIAAG
jgi:hypothetical protein